ncbi:glutamate 5-kinase [Sulfobacillus thermosulfidooxidans]|uniref:Glutamate 5-kinase n=1 Tax=Sulfobacillus thermosulfidooxidans (strain DSM 9293 / VKM B-1269 / AT-1) TaxID=929705 RepID=A0A1W1WK32_SULTA|nr:glutamate 5-kinase [Sulfobacillus thermosulfidooxidans]OLZ13040.1 glutamate 5-kinase [Sulfobacillus thermosulfidooxidans]OLZ21420.1 glutamate 5-kinase [Sulfobacillus thermosulfidooxidans]SMC06380.1 glutamate 5-kinase [Sulfobacillus thermosulfidooxidans DSM 9293]
MRIVVKIGTSSLCGDDGRLMDARVENLARQIAWTRKQHHELIVVSSGAVGAGIGHTGKRPTNVIEKQALAAIGQTYLMQAYQRHLPDISLAQILLTRQDLEHPARRANSANTIQRLLEWGALPIVNENDTVAHEEIRIGDNDTLAARVAGLIQADLLILLSDVDGLYTEDPRQDPDAQHIATVPWVSAELLNRHTASKGPWGTGGMHTKLLAARIAQEHGIPTILADSSTYGILQHLIQGDPMRATYFLSQPENS